MIAPQVKAFDCTDHDPIEDWKPSSESVWYTLTLHIGTSDRQGADLFSVTVCTPTGLNDAKQDGFAPGPEPPIVLSEYSWPEVVEAVQDRIQDCQGSDWGNIQTKLRKRFRWEYENYR